MLLPNITRPVPTAPVPEAPLVLPVSPVQDFPDLNVVNDSFVQDDPPIQFNLSDSEEEVQFVDRISSNGIASKPLPLQDNGLEIFAGANLTKAEAIPIICAYASSENLTRQQVNSTLTLLKSMTENGGVVLPSSKYLLDKFLDVDFSIAQKMFCCPHCSKVLGNRIRPKCRHCDKNIDREYVKESGLFYFSFDIRKSLQSILHSNEASSNLEKNLQERNSCVRSETIRDIVDGKFYKNLNLAGSDFSCTMNTDGVSLYKSGNKSLWPLFISINEMDYHLRRKHTCLVGLWYGKGKPNFFNFFSNFVEQCNELGRSGLKWKTENQAHISRVKFPMFAADSVARCALQGLKQYNSEYACPWCLAPGEYFKPETSGGKWVYPFETSHSAPVRTNDMFWEDVETVLAGIPIHGRNFTHHGIKEAPELGLIHDFNVVDSFVFDSMHTIILGVLRNFVLMLFDSANNSKTFYLNKDAYDAINEKWMLCTVPSNTNRYVRTMNEFARWKANEWKTFLLVCVPLLRGHLKEPYLGNFSCFVYSVFLMCSSSITEGDLTQADELMRQFCGKITLYYGKEVSSYNCHLLLHAVTCVRNHGPLWSYSLFPFEHANGQLTRKVKGKHETAKEIVNKVTVCQKIRSVANFSSDHALELYESFMDKRPFMKKFLSIGNVTLLGASHEHVLNKEDLDLLCTKLNIESNKISKDAKYFHQFIYNRQKFTSILGTSSRKRGNFYCESISGKIFKIENIITATICEAVYAFVCVTHLKTTFFSRQCHLMHTVTGVSKGYSILPIEELKTSKFVAMFDAGSTDVFPRMLVRLMNDRELE